MTTELTTEERALSAALEQALETAQQERSNTDDASHDVHHARRVRSAALHIAWRAGGGDRRVLIAAAYLHDLVNLPKNAPNRDQASSLSAQAARPILEALEFAANEIEAACHCIEAHSFSAGIQPETLDAQILQDADRIESVGALGIARTFYIAARMQSQLFHGDDPFAQHRQLDDKQYALDHFKVKLLGLADTMQTAAGREIAHERTAGMREFLAMLATELDTEQPW